MENEDEMQYDGDFLSFIKLSLVFGYGSKRLWKLYKHHQNAENFFYALYYNEDRTATEQEILLARNLPSEVVDRVLDICDKYRINVYCYESEGYPEKLRTLANPPAVIYSLGNLDFLNDNTNIIQFVGSRRPTEYTKQIMPKLIAPLAKLGFGFISGYADGVDKLTNDIARENLANNAVFLSGPIDMEKDFDRLMNISNGGAVISECVPGIKNYTAHTYSLRNRIMTCLADSVVICQEGEHGKGLDNVTYASALGKRVYVVPPGDIFDPAYFGQRDLLRKGFPPVFSSADIVYGLGKEGGEAFDLSILDETENYLYNPTQPDEKKSRKRKPKQIDDRKHYEHKLLTPQMLEEMPQVWRDIIFALDKKPLTADELSIKLQMPVQQLVTELTGLELEEVLTQDANKNYFLL